MCNLVPSIKGLNICKKLLEILEIIVVIIIIICFYSYYASNQDL